MITNINKNDGFSLLELTIFFILVALLTIGLLGAYLKVNNDNKVNSEFEFYNSTTSRLNSLYVDMISPRNTSNPLWNDLTTEKLIANNVIQSIYIKDNKIQTKLSPSISFKDTTVTYNSISYKGYLIDATGYQDASCVKLLMRLEPMFDEISIGSTVVKNIGDNKFKSNMIPTCSSANKSTVFSFVKVNM